MSLTDRLFGNFGSDMAIDLGTANTLVSVRGQGIVINEPSVVAIEKQDQRVLAVGADAKEMLGRTPGSIIAMRPLKDGVIADFDVTEAMLRYFISRAQGKRMPWHPKPRVVVCVPSGVTSVEKRAVFEATITAGARQAFLIEEPWPPPSVRVCRRQSDWFHGRRHRWWHDRGRRHQHGWHRQRDVHPYRGRCV